MACTAKLHAICTERFESRLECALSRRRLGVRGGDSENTGRRRSLLEGRELEIGVRARGIGSRAHCPRGAVRRW
eukprot:1195573-Rhodomonas_salina.5